MKRTADSLAYLEIDFSLNVRIKVAWLHRNQIVAHAITGSDYIILRRLFSAKSFPFNSLEFRTFYCNIILIKISILPIWIDFSVSVSLEEEKNIIKCFKFINLLKMCKISMNHLPLYSLVVKCNLVIDIGFCSWVKPTTRKLLLKLNEVSISVNH